MVLFRLSKDRVLGGDTPGCSSRDKKNEEIKELSQVLCLEPEDHKDKPSLCLTNTKKGTKARF